MNDILFAMFMTETFSHSITLQKLLLCKMKGKRIKIGKNLDSIGVHDRIPY